MATYWAVRIDGSWNVYADVLSMKWRLGMREPYQLMADEAEATIELDNSAGTYDPDLLALLGTHLLGKRIEIQLLDPVGGGLPVTMYTGHIEHVTVDWPAGSGAYAGQRRVTFDCVGLKQRISESAWQPGVWANFTADDVINAMIADLSLPWDTVETGQTVMPYYAPGGDTNAWDVLRDVVEGEQGRFFEGENGAVRFWNRHHMITMLPASFPVNFTGAGGAMMPYELEYVYGEQTCNHIRVQVYPYTTEPAETLWTLDAPVFVPALTSVSLEATLRRANGQFAAAASLTPSGAVWTYGTAAITVTPQGGTALITLNNTSTSGARLQALTLTGSPVVADHSITYTDEHAHSVLIHGRRGEISLDMRTLGTVDQARAVAKYILHQRALPQGTVKRLTFRRAASDVVGYHLKRVGDVFDVLLPNGVSREYVIVGMEHHVNLSLHETTFVLEPRDTLGYWLLGVAGRGELGSNTYLAY